MFQFNNLPVLFFQCSRLRISSTQEGLKEINVKVPGTLVSVNSLKEEVA
jgi:hypothetical protein